MAHFLWKVVTLGAAVVLMAPISNAQTAKTDETDFAVKQQEMVGQIRAQAAAAKVDCGHVDASHSRRSRLELTALFDSGRPPSLEETVGYWVEDGNWGNFGFKLDGSRAIPFSYGRTQVELPKYYRHGGLDGVDFFSTASLVKTNEGISFAFDGTSLKEEWSGKWFTRYLTAESYLCRIAEGDLDFFVCKTAYTEGYFEGEPTKSGEHFKGFHRAACDDPKPEPGVLGGPDEVLLLKEFSPNRPSDYAKPL